MEKVDIVIIGAGVIGLAVAAELSRRKPECSLAILERRPKFGQETSSRNSEVIHAGIYYHPGTLKALLCTTGKEMLYRFCEKWSIPYRRCGKLIVAVSPDELSSLEPLWQRGKENGVKDLEFLNRRQIAAMEPHIKAQAAIYSPSTGILNAHKFMACLEFQARQRGVMLAYCHTVTGIEYRGEHDYYVYFKDPGGGQDYLLCSWIINCAGLEAHLIASWVGLDLEKNSYKIFPCKGEYFSVSPGKGKLLSKLIYPSPMKELQGLGIHATKTIDNRLRLGPNAFYVEDPYDFRVDPDHLETFFHAVRRFLPFLTPEDLSPEIAGIRPKLQGPNDPFRDFIISHEEKKGFKGLINLLGIESPGLTCSLSIAEYVADLI